MQLDFFNKDISIVEITHKLSELLNKVQETGKVAWEIGRIAKIAKEGKSYRRIEGYKYTSFKEYCKQKLGKSDTTINGYITIYDSFENSDEISTMLISHLKEFSKIRDKELRLMAVSIYNQIQKDILFNKEDATLYPFSAKQISYFVTELNEKGKIFLMNMTEREKLIKEILLTKQKSDTKILFNRFGEPFNQTNHSSVSKVLLRQPIDEQGTVALFCILFSELKKINFQFPFNDLIKKFQFYQIDFIRQEYPDARIFVRNMSRRLYPIYWTANYIN